MSIDEIEEELGVMQLSDSFFPTGIFATSSGLEYLFVNKKITSIEELTLFIKNSLIQQIGPTDCIALAGVFENIRNSDFSKIIETDSLVFATKPVKEIREASVRSGIQLVKCLIEFVKDDEVLRKYHKQISEKNAYGVFPVAFAVCCNALGIKKYKSMAMMMYGHVVSMVGAALRLGMIQHFEAQNILHSTKSTISKLVTEYSNKSLLDMWQFAPELDVIQMSHEKMDSKMFIT